MTGNKKLSHILANVAILTLIYLEQITERNAIKKTSMKHLNRSSNQHR